MSGLQLLLGLSLLVLLHELGHYLAARAFKTRVEKFYLFFDFLFPFPGLLNFALFKKKIGDTEYGLGWFPLGGYVKIAGMMDESMDEEQMKLPPKPDEYRSKKNWQKLIIMLGGIIMNVLVAWVIYSQLLFWQGDVFVPTSGTKYGVHVDSIAIMAGFKEGDIVLSHDGGQKFESFSNIPKEMLLNEVKVIEVKRDGQATSFKVPDDFKKRAIESGKKYGFFGPILPCLVDSVIPESPATGKLQVGDRILTVNDSPAYYFHQITTLLPNLKNKDANIRILRGQDTVTATLKVTAEGTIGFRPDRDAAVESVPIHYAFLESFKAGGIKVYTTARDYLKQFKLIFSPTIKGWKQLGGIGSMASMYESSGKEGWSWVRFWTVTAFISVVLAVMNLLPIPMLDGGYVIILLVEMIIRRPLNEKFLENIQRVGFIIIIFLMVFANGNDLYKFIMNKFFHAGI